MLQPGGGPPKPGGTWGEGLKLEPGGSFAVNGMPFAFCEAGVLAELPWAKAVPDTNPNNAAITIKVLNMVPIPFPDTIERRCYYSSTLWRFLQSNLARNSAVCCIFANAARVQVRRNGVRSKKQWYFLVCCFCH